MMQKGLFVLASFVAIATSVFGKPFNDEDVNRFRPDGYGDRDQDGRHKVNNTLSGWGGQQQEVNVNVGVNVSGLGGPRHRDQDNRVPLFPWRDRTNNGWGDKTQYGWGDNTQNGWGDKTQYGWGDKTQNNGWGDKTQNNGWDYKTENGWGDKTQNGWGDKTQYGWGDKTQNGWGDKTQNDWGDKTQYGWGDKKQNNGWGDKTQNNGWGDKTQYGWGDKTQNNGWVDKTLNGWGDKTQNNGWGDKTQNGWGDKTQNGWGDKTQNGWGETNKDSWYDFEIDVAGWAETPSDHRSDKNDLNVDVFIQILKYVKTNQYEDTRSFIELFKYFTQITWNKDTKYGSGQGKFTNSGSSLFDSYGSEQQEWDELCDDVTVEDRHRRLFGLYLKFRAHSQKQREMTLLTDYQPEKKVKLQFALFSEMVYFAQQLRYDNKVTRSLYSITELKLKQEFTSFKQCAFYRKCERWGDNSVNEYFRGDLNSPINFYGGDRYEKDGSHFALFLKLQLLIQSALPRHDIPDDHSVFSQWGLDLLGGDRVGKQDNHPVYGSLMSIRRHLDDHKPNDFRRFFDDDDENEARSKFAFFAAKGYTHLKEQKNMILQKIEVQQIFVEFTKFLQFQEDLGACEDDYNKFKEWQKVKENMEKVKQFLDFLEKMVNWTGNGWGLDNKGWGDNNKGWGDNNKGWGDNNKGWGDVIKGWGDNNKRWGDVSKGWGDNNKVWGDNNKGWGDVIKGWGEVSKGWADVSKGWGDNNKGWGDDNIGWGDAIKGWGEVSKGWGDNNKGWADNNKGWADNKKGWGDNNKGWGDVIKGWGDNKKGWGDNNKGWSDVIKGWGDNNKGWGDGIKGWGDDNKGWGDNNKGWGDSKTVFLGWSGAATGRIDGIPAYKRQKN